MIEEGISKELMKEWIRPHHLARSLKTSRFSVQKLLQLRILLLDIFSWSLTNQTTWNSQESLV